MSSDRHICILMRPAVVDCFLFPSNRFQRQRRTWRFLVILECFTLAPAALPPAQLTAENCHRLTTRSWVGCTCSLCFEGGWLVLALCEWIHLLRQAIVQRRGNSAAVSKMDERRCTKDGAPRDGMVPPRVPAGEWQFGADTWNQRPDLPAPPPWFRHWCAFVCVLHVWGCVRRDTGDVHCSSVLRSRSSRSWWEGTEVSHVDCLPLQHFTAHPSVLPSIRQSALLPLSAGEACERLKIATNVACGGTEKNT